MLKHYFLQSWVCLLIPPNPPWEESVFSVGGLPDWWMALWKRLEQHISFDKEITWPEKRGDGARVPFTREPDFVIPTARFNIHAFVYLYLNADTLKCCRVAMHHCSCVRERERSKTNTQRKWHLSVLDLHSSVFVCLCTYLACSSMDKQKLCMRTLCMSESVQIFFPDASLAANHEKVKLCVFMKWCVGICILKGLYLTVPLLLEGRFKAGSTE